KRAVPRMALLSVVLVVGGGAWYAARWAETGTVLDIYDPAFVEPFQARKADFAYGRYFASFHRQKLLETPNLTMGDVEVDTHQDSPLANSFFTLLHSEIWGDHWLSFSGKRDRDLKIWPKRLSLTTALLVPLVLATLVGVGIGAFANRARRAWRAAS